MTCSKGSKGANWCPQKTFVSHHCAVESSLCKHGPIAQSAIWERLTPTADIEQLNPLEEEWTNPRNFFERVFEHVPHFLTTKYVANPPTVG